MAHNREALARRALMELRPESARVKRGDAWHR